MKKETKMSDVVVAIAVVALLTIGGLTIKKRITGESDCGCGCGGTKARTVGKKKTKTGKGMKQE